MFVLSGLSIANCRERLCHMGGSLITCVMLQAPQVKQEATSELAKQVLNAYIIVYNGAKAHEQLRQAIDHTPEQVKTILGITQQN